MKITFLSRSNNGQPHAFVREQAEALMRNHDVQIEHYLIEKGGVSGMLQASAKLFHHLKANKPDIVHVHYGLWATVPIINKYLLLRKFKLVVTYHGSDVFKQSERPFSEVAAYFAAHNILVSPRMSRYIHNKTSVIPCGIDTNIKMHNKQQMRQKYNWLPGDFVVLFSSNFQRPVKDPPFAFEVIRQLSETSSKNIKFIELTGYNRDQLTEIMQAADVLLMCSKSEGSPQVIKEAILNALPVVSNDIGDVRSICEGADNCYIISKNVAGFVAILAQIANEPVRIANREIIIERFDNNKISNEIFAVYASVLNIKTNTVTTQPNTRRLAAELN